MNANIITRHNLVVSPVDDVYILGDLCLGPDIQANRELLMKLSGKLHIVYGNHDTKNRQEMYNSLPNVVEAAPAIILDYNKYHFYLSHYPTLTGNLENENIHQMILNLFGHTHQRTNFFEDRPYMYHVGVDSHDCFPVALDSIIPQIKEQVDKCKEYL